MGEGRVGLGEEDGGGPGRGLGEQTLIAKPLSTKTSSSFCTCCGTCADWAGVKGWGVPGNVSSCTPSQHSSVATDSIGEYQVPQSLCWNTCQLLLLSENSMCNRYSPGTTTAFADAVRMSSNIKTALGRTEFAKECGCRTPGCDIKYHTSMQVNTGAEHSCSALSWYIQMPKLLQH